MRRKLGAGGGLDSSEMMLDTLTNVFGAVILIACVLAILPRHVMAPPLLADEAARAQMVERRIEAAEAEVKELKADLAKLGADVDPVLAELESRRESLRGALESLQKDVRQMRESEVDTAALRALALGSSPEAMAERLRELRDSLAREQSSAGVAREKVEFLKRRLAMLSEEARLAGQGRLEMVRFPREKGVRRGSFPVIVSGGGIYPLVVGAEHRANPAVRRLPVEASSDAFRAELVKGKGMKLPEDRDVLIRTLKSAVAADLAISIYLYPDSHELFQDLKAVVFEAGGSYGVEFQEAGSKLTFGSEGTQPPEL
jgi:F0F1-type ATP synthase membrane subunit b/b'